MGLHTLLGAFLEIFSGGGLLYLAAGAILGLVFGVIPGLGGVTALALLIPVSYNLDALQAMYLAGGVMGSVSFGGSISAILLEHPRHRAECGDLLRRLSAGAAGQGRAGDRRLRRGLGAGRADRSGDAAGRSSRSPARSC